MEAKRILYVSSELTPYSTESCMSTIALKLPKLMQSQGNDVRVFMPKFGIINERRHQLHEVIRLSGMNLIINDIDQPLIIKVASIPSEKLQVYFIDNDEYFKRKNTYTDDDGVMHADNDERAIFFAKGVLETVKKLNWRPDIIHVFGWMSSLIPLYLKKYYAEDAFFQDVKIVVSLFNKQFQGELNPELVKKLTFDKFSKKDLQRLIKPTYENIIIHATDFADTVIQSDEIIPDAIANHIQLEKNIVLENIAIDRFEEVYASLYQEEVVG